MWMLVVLASLAAESSSNATVAGVVVDYEQGAPIQGVTVQITVSGKHEEVIGTTTTDAGGEFVFSEVPPGYYFIVAGPPGAAFYPTIHAHPGERVDDVQLVMLPSSVTVSGAVTDEDGNPIPGAKIWSALPSRWDIEVKPDLSDSQGHFVWRSLNREEPLRVMADGYATMVGLPKVESETLVFRMPKLRSVSGNVVDSRGRAVANKKIQFNHPTEHAEHAAPDSPSEPYLLQDPCLHEAMTDNEGRFKVEGLYATWYDVRLAAEEIRDTSYSSWHYTAKCTPARCEVTADSDLSGQTFRVTAEEDFGSLRLQVLDTQTGDAINEFDADLESIIPGLDPLLAKYVDPGPIEFTVTAEGYAPQKVSLTVAPGETKKQTVRLKAGDRLYGKIVSGPMSQAPYGDVRQFLPGTKSENSAEERGQTDARIEEGSQYVMGSVRPGRALFVARRYDTMPHCERLQSKWITFADGESVEADFDLTGSATLQGRITCPLGCSGNLVIRPADAPGPVPWRDPAAFYEQAVGIASFCQLSFTDDRYVIPDLPPGTYAVTAGWHEEDGHEIREERRTLTLKAGETATLDIACFYPGEEEIAIEPGSIQGTLVEGLVVDAATGKSLPGVAVQAQDERDYRHRWERVTDQEGVFSFTDLPAGDYAIHAVPPEDAAMFGAQHPYIYRRVKLGSSGGIKNIRFKISRVTATLTGRVYDEDNSPVANAEIQVSPSFTGLAGSGNATLKCVSDSEGRYRLHGLYMARTPTARLFVQSLPLYDGQYMDSPYTITVSAPGYARKVVDMGLACAQTQRMNFRLVRGACIAGRLVDSKGGPMPGMRVTLRPDSDAMWPHKPSGETEEILNEAKSLRQYDNKDQQTDSEGRFLFNNLLPFAYELCLEHGTHSVPSEITLKSGEVLNRDFVVGDTGELAVIILDKFLGFVEPTHLRRIDLTCEDGSKLQSAYEFKKPEAQYLFKGLPPGTIRCEVEVEGGGVAAETVEIAAATTKRIDFRIHGSCVLTGHVNPPPRYGGCKILARVPGQWAVSRADVEETGEYRMGEIEPGTYLFSASQQEERGSSSRMQSKWVTIEQGKIAQADFDLSGTASISGTFTFPEGRAGMVVVQPVAAPDPIPWNDPQGLYEHLLGKDMSHKSEPILYKFTHLPAGAYKVTAAWFTPDPDIRFMKNDIHETTQQVTLSDNQQVALDLEGK